MMLRLLSTALFAALLCSPAFAQDELELKSGDRKKMAKAVGSWVNAEIDQDSSDRLDAIDAILKAMAGVNKKLKGKNLFSLITDWKEILTAERKYPRVKTGRVLIQSLPTSDSAEYALWVPKAYKPSKGALPCLLLLADGGATGASVIEALPEGIKDSTVILVPDFQGLTKEDLGGTARFRLLFSLAIQSQKLRLNRDKVYLMGVGSSAPLAASLAAYMPHFFAGAAIVGESIPADLPATNVQLAVMKEHPDLVSGWAWLSQLPPRDLAKKELEFSLPFAEFPTVYWIVATKFDPLGSAPDGKMAKMKVSVDRNTNTITIDSEFVYQVNLMLNDSLLDLSKEVTIVRNGQAIKAKYNRGVSALLENFKQLLFDGGAVFPVSARGIDIPLAK